MAFSPILKQLLFWKSYSTQWGNILCGESEVILPQDKSWKQFVWFSDRSGVQHRLTSPSTTAKHGHTDQINRCRITKTGRQKITANAAQKHFHHQKWMLVNVHKRPYVTSYPVKRCAHVFIVGVFLFPVIFFDLITEGCMSQLIGPVLQAKMDLYKNITNTYKNHQKEQ